MEQIFKQDYDFEPIPLRKFKAFFGKEDPQDLLKAFQKAEETCEKNSKSLNIAYDYMKRIIDNLKRE